MRCVRRLSIAHSSLFVVAVVTALAASLLAATDAEARVIGFGGTTAQRWPVMVELSRNGRQVVRTVVGIELHCTSGDYAWYEYGFVRLPVTKKRTFRSSDGPTPIRQPDGTIIDWSDSVTGKINAAGTAISGSWSMTATYRDVAGTVTDTCTSGSVTWKARH